jgi:hypothetical protein
MQSQDLSCKDVVAEVVEEADNHNRNQSNLGKRCRMSADPSVKCSPHHSVVQAGEVSLPDCGASLDKRLAPM